MINAMKEAVKTAVNEKIGTAANLLNGFDSKWLSKERGNNALFPSKEKPLLEFDETGFDSEQKGRWGDLSVSLHDTPESLMDRLLPYQIKNPSYSIAPVNLPSGAMLLGNGDSADAFQNLSETLGVDLSAKNVGFVLVQLKRNDGNMAHPSRQMGLLIHPNPARIPNEVGITESFRKQMSGLKRIRLRGAAFSPEDITIDDAQQYLDFYENTGSHFISNISVGDCLFQVYVMPKERFELVKKDYAGQEEMLEGSYAQLFRQYTTSYETGNSGYVQTYGKILCFSQSEALQQTIADKDWVENSWAKTDSIFAVYQTNSKVSIRALNKTFLDSTALMTDLSSISLFAEHSRKQIWERIFKACAVQKYTDAIHPFFNIYDPLPIEKIPAMKDDTGFLSDLVTPIINSYKPGLNVSNLDFVNPNPELVNDVTLYTNFNYHTATKAVKIPGRDVLICGQKFSLEGEGFRTFELGDEAFDQLSFFAQQFFGALLIRNTSGNKHSVIVDGLQYLSVKGENGRNKVVLGGDVRKVPSRDQLERIKSSLQFHYVFISGNINTLNGASDDDEVEFYKSSVKWLTDMIPEDTSDRELLELRVKALNLYYVEQSQYIGAYVPILPADSYQKHLEYILSYADKVHNTITEYQHKIRERKRDEMSIQIAQEMNQNIVDSGNLLSGYVNANLSQQQALSDHYKLIIEQQLSEKEKQQRISRDLQLQLNSQQAEVNTNVKNYKQAIKDQQLVDTIRNSINLCLDVATNLFDLVNPIVTPANSISAAKHMGLNGQRIQKFRNIIKATSNFFSDLSDDIGSVVDAQRSFDDTVEPLSTNLSWDLMKVDMSSILEEGPSGSIVDPKKEALERSFANLVTIGKALTDAEAGIQKIAGEISNNKQQQALIDDQAERLGALDTTLKEQNIEDLDVQNIDLIGMTGGLVMLQSNIMGTMASCFSMKDQALQYAFLQEPTPITLFNTLGIQQALLNQNSKTIYAEELMRAHQASTTTPIVVEVKIPATHLKKGNHYRFNVNNAPGFEPYVHMRVQSVVAQIEGVKSSASGNYLLNLSYTGRPFFDRGMEREVMTFHTLRRERDYLYEVEGNKAMFSDLGESWSEGVSQITPFSTWEVSLPATQINQDILFDDLILTLKLTFVMKARIHDKEIVRQARGRRMLTASKDAASEEDVLLKNISGKSVLNGWDVMFNMSAKQINLALAQQYEELKEKEAYVGVINASTAIQEAGFGDLDEYSLQKFHIEYGYPKLSFLNDNKDCSLEMEIHSGSVEKGKRYIGEDNEDNREDLEYIAKRNKVPAEDIKEIKDEKGQRLLMLEYYKDNKEINEDATLSATLQLSKTKGLVDNDENILSVSLNMQDGAFKANDITVEMSDAQNIAFSEAVKDYFAENPVQFIINSLDLKKISTLPDMCPHQFVIGTNYKYKLMQLFIQTNDRTLPDDYSDNLSWNNQLGTPIPDQYECSLMVSSEIFFDSILPSGITDWELEGVEPKKLGESWSTQFSTANISLKVDLRALGWESLKEPFKRYSYAPTDGNPVSWSLSGMLVKPTGENGIMGLSYSEENKFYFTETARWTMGSISGSKKKESKKNESTDVTMHISGFMSTEIIDGDEERDQQVKAYLDKNTADIDARTSGGGACGSDDLQAQINQQLYNQVPGQIEEALKGLDFTSVSTFALKNLLFPSNNYINLESSKVPGDLVIFGKFQNLE